MTLARRRLTPAPRAAAPSRRASDRTIQLDPVLWAKLLRFTRLKEGNPAEAFVGIVGARLLADAVDERLPDAEAMDRARRAVRIG